MSTTAQLSDALKLTFEFQGAERALAKHPRVVRDVKLGKITEQDALATPWFIRISVDGKQKPFKLAVDNDAAIRAAVAHLKGKQNKPDEWKQFLQDRAAKNGITLGALATEWKAAGLPNESGHPRDKDARATVEAELDLAMAWWENKPAAAVTPGQHMAFATWKRSQCKESGRGTGDRAVDKQLAALSCMCAWAVACEKLSKNPFAERQQFQDSKTVQHCHEFQPDTDEDWHKVLGWFWSYTFNQAALNKSQNAEQLTLRLRVAGAWLAWTGLVGLRPEEPRHLFRFQALKEIPTNPAKLKPGTIFPTRDGSLKMRVERDKNGQNPYVLLHPAAKDFLNHWHRWLAANIQPVQNTGFALALFPMPDEPTRPLFQDKGEFPLLNKWLHRACRTMNLSTLKPKGCGRAYYVRVRRSDGMEDNIIAGELGQTTDGALIRSTYGDGDDMRGSGLFDWLPKESKPAWHALLDHTRNILPIAL